MRMELRKTFQFEAAHLLPHLPKSMKFPKGSYFVAQIAADARRSARVQSQRTRSRLNAISILRRRSGPAHRNFVITAA